MVQHLGRRKYSAAPALAGLLLLGLGACAHRTGGTSTAASAPPPAAAQVPAVYYVFFERWSADLVPEARGVIAGAARDAARVRPNSVHVSGYADPEGDKAANEKLSQERAQRVATALIADGVPPWAVKIAPYGEVADVVTPQGDRRVRILFR